MMATLKFISIKVLYPQIPLYPFYFILYPSLIASGVNDKPNANNK